MARGWSTKKEVKDSQVDGLLGLRQKTGKEVEYWWKGEKLAGNWRTSEEMEDWRGDEVLRKR